VEWQASAPWWRRVPLSEAPAQAESCRNGASSPPLHIAGQASRRWKGGGL